MPPTEQTISKSASVPLIDLKAQYASIREETRRVIDDVLESQYFINGPAVREFEDALALYVGTKHAIGVSSGTDALLAALMTLGIGGHPSEFRDRAPDEVITTTYSFFATGGAIWRAGATPVFVDIDPETYLMDVSQIEARITSQTKAIMPVHLYGQCVDMNAINDIADKHDLVVIEDAAQAIGATQNGVQAGAMGTVGCFSLFPTKNLGGLGDGGFCTTNDDDLAERLRQSRNHGMEPKYYHHWIGGNFRLDTLQAAGCLVKLPHLESWHEGRRRNAAFYNKALGDVAEITTPAILDGNTSVYNQYIVRVPDRDACRAYLQERNISAEIYYPVPMHLQTCFEALGHTKGDLPVSERAADETLALPIYAELTDEQLDHVASTLISFVDSR
ncbi:MAG: DegT/DnrJ/EryC1/StrS family aminotransferase [Planctomycetota bacterium]|jgi:dTDP-4-amino-4,6-dideoxygalactose transaminase